MIMRLWSSLNGEEGVEEGGKESNPYQNLILTIAPLSTLLHPILAQGTTP